MAKSDDILHVCTDTTPVPVSVPCHRQSSTNFSIASLSMSNHMAEETPRHQKQTTLVGMLEDRNQVGFKITGKLKALLLSGEEDGLLRVRDLGDPLYDATCLGCGWAECCWPTQPVHLW